MSFFSLLDAKRLTLVCVLGIVSAAMSVLMLASVQSVIENFGESTNLVYWTFALTLLAFSIAGYIALQEASKMSAEIISRIQLSTLSFVVSSPYRLVERLGKKYLYAVLTEDIQNVSLMLRLLPEIIQCSLIVVGCLIYLFIVSTELFFGLVAVLVIGMMTALANAQVARKYLVENRDCFTELHEEFRGAVEGSKEYRLGTARHSFQMDSVFHGLIDRMRALTLRSDRHWNFNSIWSPTLVYLAIVGLVFGLNYSDSEAGLSTLVAYSITILYLANPLTAIVNAMGPIEKGRISLRRINDLQHAGPEMSRCIKYDSEPKDIDSWHSLHLEGLVYQHENSDFMLGPVDLSIRRGEVLFITGANGAGKTTLIKILCGLYTPQAGRVVCEDNQGKYRCLNDLSSVVQATFQDSYVFRHCISDSGSPASDEKIAGYLNTFELPHRLATSEGIWPTLDVSGGQYKRMALIETLLVDTPVYVFDEAAAEQDSRFREYFYRELLPRLKKNGHAVVVVSHDSRYFDVGDRLVEVRDGGLVCSPL